MGIRVTATHAVHTLRFFLALFPAACLPACLRTGESFFIFPLSAKAFVRVVPPAFCFVSRAYMVCMICDTINTRASQRACWRKYVGTGLFVRGW